MKKLLLLIVSALLLSGCATTPTANSLFSAEDLKFAEEMIPHHEQAILMSDIALTNSTSDEVLALARDIKAAQEPEVELMGSWQGVRTSTHMGHTMDGMLSDEEIQSLRDAEGATFDRLFLEGMIKHHQGAIEMADMIVDSQSPRASTLGKAIVETQQAEIEKMKELLGR